MCAGCTVENRANASGVTARAHLSDDGAVYGGVQAEHGTGGTDDAATQHCREVRDEREAARRHLGSST
jgi:hypothetical protein